MASSKVLKLTEGVLSRITDLSLALIFYQLELGRARNMRGVEKAAEGAQELMSEVNYKSIKRALSELKRKGFIRTARAAFMEVEITSSGERRLRAGIPQYQKRRSWDKNIYLVTYDIPVLQNRERNTLRKFLQKIGCGALQESVWVTPYNPTQLVREFIEEWGIGGTVLVSLLGKDGSVGGMTTRELVEQVYGLAELNRRYQDFLARGAGESLPLAQATFLYLSILKDDPQLPFELLPDWWAGEKANTRFEKMRS